MPIAVPAHASAPWMVRFPSGRRYFKTEEEARNAIDQHLAGEEVVNKRDLDDIRAIKRMLAGTGANPVEAVRYYLDHAGRSSERLISDLLDEWLAAQSPDWRPKYRESVDVMVKVAKAAFDGLELRELNIERVRKFVAAAGGARNPQWDAFVRFRSFLGWCKANQLIGDLPLPPVPRPKKGKIHFTAIDDVSRLLRLCMEKHPSAVVPLAVQLFTGIRTAELMRLKWQFVNIAAREIKITEEVAKNESSARTVDWWPDNLVSWLMLAKRNGPVATAGYLRTKIRLQAEARAAGIDVKQNDMRHNYATYGVAFFQAADRIALQIGHVKAATLFKHYRGFVPQADAKTYFAITPDSVRDRTDDWWEKLIAA